MNAEKTQHTLKQYFGYDHFREGQKQLIDAILSGRDCLGIMPTGAGKSICFQLPALLLEGVTLVVSPLISLMKDQVNALTQAGIAAAYLNSSLTEQQSRRAMENARAGLYRILYIAPERLDSPGFLELVQHISISMVTVDEAHCISQWGQDFRPSYRKIHNFVHTLPHRPVVSAFTATATPKVREDIAQLLHLDNPVVLVTGFDRKNLFFAVRKPERKDAALLRFLAEHREQSGIVYCSTRNSVEEVCDLLRRQDYAASRYHAGLPDAERSKNQDDFLYDRVKIMVATNAFGMGIDKSNVRFVVHYNMPKDMESYYQEAGRAGRDGEPADCLLLYAGQDVRTCQFLIENSRDADGEDARSQERLKERDRQRLRAMTLYCHTNDCLRAYFLRYFGETPPASCGACANCLGEYETCDVTVAAQKILSCVARLKERFGVKTVIDVLRGSKNEKLLRLGLENLSTYGICTESEKQLREIVQHLVLHEYLCSTDAEYPVLRLGPRAAGVLYRREPVEMKRPKGALASRQARGETPHRVDPYIFARLSALRAELARKQSVPAYVVFTDSALTDMCLRLPATPEEMLHVSGVGQRKLERYGEAFLNAIAELRGSAAEEKPPQEPPKPDTPEVSAEPVTVSAIADRINCVLLQQGRKKLSGAKINTWLVEQGYLQVQTSAQGSDFKVPSPAGEAIGIRGEWRELRGQKCLVNVYDARAQRFVLDALEQVTGE